MEMETGQPVVPLTRLPSHLPRFVRVEIHLFSGSRVRLDY